MKLLIICIKRNTASRCYRLYKQDNDKLTEIGFSGLKTDYSEIAGNKKTFKDGHFYYVSKKYRFDGIPRDIIYNLRKIFDEITYIDNYYNGITVTTIEKNINEYLDNYYYLMQEENN